MSNLNFNKNTKKQNSIYHDPCFDEYCVYIATHSEFPNVLKIGKSSRVSNRELEIQKSDGAKQIILIFPIMNANAEHVEKICHNIFKKYNFDLEWNDKQCREWFDLNIDEKSSIDILTHVIKNTAKLCAKFQREKLREQIDVLQQKIESCIERIKRENPKEEDNEEYEEVYEDEIITKIKNADQRTIAMSLGSKKNHFAKIMKFIETYHDKIFTLENFAYYWNLQKEADKKLFDGDKILRCLDKQAYNNIVAYFSRT